MCLSLELRQIECALKNDVSDLYVTADHGHNLIVYNLLSSYRTPLQYHTWKIHCLFDIADISSYNIFIHAETFIIKDKSVFSSAIADNKTHVLPAVCSHASHTI